MWGSKSHIETISQNLYIYVIILGSISPTLLMTPTHEDLHDVFYECNSFYWVINYNIICGASILESLLITREVCNYYIYVSCLFLCGLNLVRICKWPYTWVAHEQQSLLPQFLSAYLLVSFLFW
jgi:hypothetical protein